MSLVRAPLILLHAILYQMASTPPNKTPPKGRYDNTEAPWIRIAPLIFKVSSPPPSPGIPTLPPPVPLPSVLLPTSCECPPCVRRRSHVTSVARRLHPRLSSFHSFLVSSHLPPLSARADARPSFSRCQIQQPLVWLCTLADILLVLSHHLPAPALRTSLHAVLCPSAPAAATATPFIRPTLPFFTGLALVAAGTLLRLTCYRSLGPFFTFDLAILPKHQLVTSGPYRFVRHPAYSGSLLILAGLGLADLSAGGWIAECVSAGARSHSSSGIVPRMFWAWAVFAVWYAWWLAVGVRRARMEDAALRKEFGKQWDEYAARVRWWFVPGVL
ncbi:hypothetical protein OH77DRAFT_93738 [Trametes cingulata]|nr:hypothetical protein OH77DRAFT_93738 [Trametes cingulata]